jgi:hypothetical protein
MPIGVLYISASVAIAVAALAAVRRRVPLEILQEQHEVAGVCFAVVGGLYGIILAFVLVSSWERFETARHQTEIEANALADLNRQAAGFSQPTRSRLARATAAYAQAVIDREWPEMAKGSLSEEAQQAYLELWNAVLDARPTQGFEIALYQNALGTLSQVADSRRDRLLYMRTGMPNFIWSFLLALGVATVAFTYLFGMRRLMPQIVITAVLAGAIAWTLVLVNETQTPYSGDIRIPDRAFRIALGFIRSDPDAPDPAALRSP